ncbi:hypothetical protein OQH61_05805 [Helicobacter sp. MIT 21-1697]|uniref:hypothetical protein n=1 Tax=Helicobacter sp. MIT 21-1697 TaxID=2993733 RepID=UPI00224AA908|nr:hypothetical protein [Helicobacter sp. MIT 21-1697]MCX2717249.1 hypothetical protein [Helicobacter sp. MIT 21-1697]
MNNDERQSNLGFTLKFGNQQGTSAEFGMINSNPNAPYSPNNSVVFYNPETKQKVMAIACIVDCPFDMINKEQQNENDILNFGKQTAESTKDSINITESTKQLESTNPNNPTQPFTYQDSNITAKEIINDDDTSTLVIESHTNLLEYQGNLADTLMAGVSGVFGYITLE